MGGVYRGPGGALRTRQAVTLQAMSPGGGAPCGTRPPVCRGAGTGRGGGRGRLLHAVPCGLRRVSVDGMDTLQCHLWSR